jgi:hypothetical protein
MTIQYVWAKPTRPNLLTSLVNYISDSGPYRVFRDVQVTDKEVTAFAAREEYAAERSAILMSRTFPFTKREICE